MYMYMCMGIMCMCIYVYTYDSGYLKHILILTHTQSMRWYGGIINHVRQIE